MTTIAALLHFAGRVLIAVSEELLRALETRDTQVPDTVPVWLDEATDV